MKPALTVLLWIGFFATSVYGHVALKIAVDTRKDMLSATLSFFGLSAYLAWGASAALWMMVLSRHSLMSANAISTLRYALVAVGAAVFLREQFDTMKIIGSCLVAVGVWLVVR